MQNSISVRFRLKRGECPTPSLGRDGGSSKDKAWGQSKRNMVVNCENDVKASFKPWGLTEMSIQRRAHTPPGKTKQRRIRCFALRPTGGTHDLSPFISVVHFGPLRKLEYTYTLCVTLSVIRHYQFIIYICE